MRRSFTLLIALAMLMLGAAPGLANNTWSGYHFADGDNDDHSNDGIALKLVNHLTNYTDEYPDVVADWEDVAKGSRLALTSSNDGGFPLACQNVSTDAAGDDIAGTVHVCNDSYGKIGWLGLARIWIAPDGHIEAGVALMNDSYFQESGSVYNDEIAYRHVLCQEIGHTFGLSHQGSPKKQSCMNDRWGLTSTAFQSPNQHDYDTLNEIYGAASTDDGGGDSSKLCNPNRKNCPTNGANVHFAPRPGGGWVVTFTFPALQGLR